MTRDHVAAGRLDNALESGAADAHRCGLQARTHHAKDGQRLEHGRSGQCSLTLTIYAGVTNDARAVAVDKLLTAGLGA